jgi:pimeloyl-ACP methyl ester carboxylesterase
LPLRQGLLIRKRVINASDMIFYMSKIIKTKSFKLAVYEKGDREAKKLAIVIPGRLDTKDYIHMTSLVNHLAGKGYHALSFDPPGTWESPGDIELYTVTNTLKAIDELLEHFNNKPAVLIGHSRGGTISMLASTTNPYITHFVAIMSSHGPTMVDLPEKEGEDKVSYRDLPPGTTRTKEQKRFDLPYSYFEDQKKYDALTKLKGCTKPKLFFFGAHDNLVTKKEVQESFNASAEPKQIIELNSEHDYRLQPKVVAQVNNRVGEFLNSSS